jgi:hypothetical protein
LDVVRWRLRLDRPATLIPGSSLIQEQGGGSTQRARQSGGGEIQHTREEEEGGKGTRKKPKVALQIWNLNLYYINFLKILHLV